RSDQYSLAVILYQMVTGKRPFEADSMYSILHGIVQGEFARPREVNPTLPEGLERAIVRGMSKSPNDRVLRVGDFGNAILAYASPRGSALWTAVFGPPAEPTAPMQVSPQIAADVSPAEEALERTETSPPSPLADPVLADAALLVGE